MGLLDSAVKIGTLGLADSAEDLFGGGDQTTTSTRDPFNPELAQEYLTRLDELIGTRRFFPGQTIAGLTPDQLMGMDLSKQFAMGGAQDLYGQTAASQGMFLDPSFMDPDKNPYMKRYVESAIRPVTQQLNEQVLPAIGDQALASGNYGGSRQGIAEGIAKRGYLDTVGDITSGMYTDLYGNNINAVQNAMNMSPMIANMGMLPGQIMSNVGATQQAQEQAEIASDVEEYNYNRDLEYNDLLTLLGVNAQTGGTTTNFQPGQGPLAGMMGTAMMAAPMMFGAPPIPGGVPTIPGGVPMPFMPPATNPYGFPMGAAPGPWR